MAVREKVKKIEGNRMRIGYIIDILTSVDIQEIVKVGESAIQNYQGVVYRENFKISPSTEVIEKLFALRKNI